MIAARFAEPAVEARSQAVDNAVDGAGFNLKEVDILRVAVRERRRVDRCTDSGADGTVNAVCCLSNYAAHEGHVCPDGKLDDMMTIKLSCETRGIAHEWRRREERYSLYSTQSAGSTGSAGACGAETDTEEKPASDADRAR